MITSDLGNALFGNLLAGLRIIASWAILLTALGYGLATVNPTMQQASIVLANELFSFFAAPSIMAAWCRLILIGENPRMVHLRFRRRELGIYARRLKLILVTIPLFPLGAFCLIIAARSSETASTEFASLMPWMVTVLFGIAASYAQFRFAFIIPSFAIGQPIPLRNSFNLSKGYFLPTIVAVSAFILPILLGLGVAYSLKHQLAPAPFQPRDYLWLLPSIVAVQIMIVSILSAAISVAYRHAVSSQTAEIPSKPVPAAS